ncbi:MAG: 2-oxo acid dehydrogenase subunit E2 [Deltaproteobacteria bacterium]|nr:2-oxo acid dehydrogenase subunit E2 [Deltaproteobacteria bacterium]
MTTIQMPKLGHTMTEGKVIRWHKQPGEAVRQGEAILTIETDKTEVEVESPVDGMMGAHAAREGDTVAVGGMLVTLLAPGETQPAAGASAPASSSLSEQRSLSPASDSTMAGRRTLASPRARRLAAEHGIDLSRIAGHGSDGVVTEDDVRAAIGAFAAAPAARATDVSVPPIVAALAPARREKLTRIQQIGARNLVASWQSVPHFVQMVRVDMSRALAVRKAFNAAGGNLSVTDLLLYAAARALTENPRINAAFADGEMLIYDRVNLGVAVDTPEGLVVPVVHDAHQMGLAELSDRARQLAQKARAKKLAPAELEGATFTVSNLGAFGVENGTPVIFAPQAALMFAGAVRDDVLAIAGRAEVRPVMEIAIAYDHRGIDGATAARFTVRIRQLLEAAEFPGVPANMPAPAFAKRQVAVEFNGEGLRTRVRHGSIEWANSAEADEGPDPVTSFMGSLCSCLLMSLRVAAHARKFDLAAASLSGRCTETGHVKAIDLELRVSTSEPEDRLKRLVEVAERGCHIRALVRADLPMTLRIMRI